MMTRTAQFLCIVFLCAAAHPEAAAQCGTNKNGPGRDKPLHPPPKPAWSVTGLCLGDTAHFYNHTLGAQCYLWSIMDAAGDTIYSTEDTDLLYYFDSAGSYAILLRAYNGHWAPIEDTVTIGEAVYADFSLQRCTSGGTRFVAHAGCADQVLWRFHDGSTAPGLTTEFRYDSAGTYPVTLIASNSAGADSVTQDVVIYATGIPTGGFTYIQRGDTVWFKPDDKDGTWYSWDFGDGQFLDTAAPVTVMHVFDPNDDNNLYYVLLYVSNQCGINFTQQEIDTRNFTDLAETVKTIRLIVYPNPASGEFRISNRECRMSKCALRIYDISGKVVLRSGQEGSINQPISIGHLPSGVYYVELRTDHGSAWQKLIKL